ncbi:FAD-dependent thymidylate synthase [Peribacillus frigoritolerans]|uniref:FAD-dependent thymidylate synthase n=1 Tax=Peribacillus frigoritolerans TaxID=450367 RepID=UPI002EC74A67|nr:FAD-dependent thymidylate synthase [Peribacillus frigoritolerans]
MNVKLLAHTQLVEDIFLIDKTGNLDWETPHERWNCTDGQTIALTAIRTCYSHLEPSEIVETEAGKYFGKAASDGKGGTDADRLMRHIINSGHTSTLEHLTYTFAIEGVSRSLLAQITRHRHFSFSVQSQRYNKLESDSKSGGFDHVVPDSVENCKKRISIFDDFSHSARDVYNEAMEHIQQAYDTLREAGVPAEDARFVLPNAATCNLVLTGNLRSFLDFHIKRSAKGAQWEIRELSDLIKNAIVEVEPWTENFFITG